MAYTSTRVKEPKVSLETIADVEDTIESYRKQIEQCDPKNTERLVQLQEGKVSHQDLLAKLNAIYRKQNPQHESEEVHFGDIESALDSKHGIDRHIARIRNSGPLSEDEKKQAFVRVDALSEEEQKSEIEKAEMKKAEAQKKLLALKSEYEKARAKAWESPCEPFVIGQKIEEYEKEIEICRKNSPLYIDPVRQEIAAEGKSFYEQILSNINMLQEQHKGRDRD